MKTPKCCQLNNTIMTNEGYFLMNIDRYLKIVAWSRARYTQGGNLVLSKGGVPSRFRLIEDIAAEKYMTCPRHYPEFTIKGTLK